jgi:hypothetical protein
MEEDRQPACLSEEEILHIAERIARRNHLPKVNTRRLHAALLETKAINLGIRGRAPRSLA